MCDLQLNTVTYGTASAPYQAVKCLQELAERNKQCFLETAVVVLNDFYMDDLMSGEASVDKALNLQRQVIQLLESGGFVL